MKKYDLHIHTYHSGCSRIRPKKLLQIAKKKGLNGIAVTDHNTIKGGKEVKKLNKDKNFEVIIGAEIKTDKGEILGLYLKKEIKSRKAEDVIDEIHKQEGIAVAAHPFTWGLLRTAAKFNKKELKKLDGFETFNARNTFRWENELAVQFAQKHNLAQTGGSDAHFYYEIGRAFTLFNGSLRDAIKKRKTAIMGRIAPLPFGRTFSMFKKILK
ncbi:PHP domain-containing protein [Candidatus Woesearchaeota archaeon]|nr:PHP domain-containing protein [Candidatus Woesearchaeota archaeon]